MAVNVSLEIKGLNEIMRLWNKAPKVVEMEMRKALNKAVIILQGAAVMRTPVDTNRLRGGHKVTMKIGAFEAKLFNPVKYAIYVHEGTRFMKGRPFYDDAIKKESPRIDRIFDKALEDITNKL